MMMNHPPSSPNHSYMTGGMVSRNSHLFNGGSLSHGVNGQLQNMQISSLAAAQQAMTGGLLGDNHHHHHHHHNHVNSMLDPTTMMSLGMSTDDGMPVDPQLCGDQFSPMSASAAPTSMMNEYGNLGGGSTLTEFTKRRNWSQRILEELQDFLHILSPTGKIVYASPSAKSLTGFDPEELMGKFITEFIHQDDSGLFVREFNESIATGQPLRLFYRFQKTDGTYAIFETNGHPHIGEAPPFGPSAMQSVCKGFFMMSRPYPTRNAALLDSFLEHKIENERLVKRINELKKEEYEEHQQQQRQRQQYPGPRTDSGTAGSSMTSNVGNDTPMTSAQTPNSLDNMPPPAKPTQQQTSAALTRQNLDRMEQSGLAKTDSIRDKMARFEGATHMDTIEMLTGLRYREGERSKGISTGDTSPALIRGDAGVPIPIDKESRHTSEKKKKQKIADEYVCTDCGTLDSPEWRKGPKGPKTLCNACGLRWAKKEKKRNQNPNVVSIPPPGSGGGSLPG